MLMKTAPIQNYTTIDIAKFICALLIVMLHVHVGDMFGKHQSWLIQSLLFRLAVPFFFISSGFFLVKKITYNSDFSYIKSYIIRLLKPCFLWLTINTVLEIIKFIMSGKDVVSIFISVIRALIFYPYGALWYVYALILGVLIMYYFITKLRMSISLLLLISFMMYAFALLCNNYYWVGEQIGINNYIDIYLFVFKTARNGFFVGFPFLLWGYLLGMVKDKFVSKKKLLFILLIALAFIFYSEVIFLEEQTKVDDYSMFVSFPLLISCIFVILLNTKSSISPDISKLFRKLSAGIYFSHRAFYSILMIACSMYGVAPIPIEYFICVLSLSIFFCLICYKYYPQYSVYLS